MMPQVISQDKSKVWDQLAGLWAEVVTAAQAGTGVHEIEGKLLRGVLKLGYEFNTFASVSSEHYMKISYISD